jgi:hypothetical protein
MPVPSRSSGLTGEHRISGPAELVQAVPYLLGFRPRSSLVLVGLRESAIVVTARLDLAEGDPRGAVEHTVGALARAGSTDIVAMVCDEGVPPRRSAAVPLPWRRLIDVVEHEAHRAGCSLSDALLVGALRWWSYACADAGCCPPAGRPLPTEPSTFAAAATVAGIAVLPDRAAVEAQLDPVPAAQLAAVAALIEPAEHDAVSAVLAGGSQRHDRAVKRATFAAARASGEARWRAPADAEVARFGVALNGLAVRDSVWMAVDDDRLDGRELWRNLATRLPAPYRAGPLFLLGWRAWRHGDGATARIAAERAIEADPGYSAADMLLAALNCAVDPRRMRKLRMPRPA